jgi:hypothetical protein
LNPPTFFWFALHLDILQVNAAEFFGIFYYFPFIDVHAIGSYTVSSKLKISNYAHIYYHENECRS